MMRLLSILIIVPQLMSMLMVVWLGASRSSKVSRSIGLTSLPVMTRCNRMIYVKPLLVRAFVAEIALRNLRNAISAMRVSVTDLFTSVEIGSNYHRQF